jgi:hypothetical protein
MVHQYDVINVPWAADDNAASVDVGTHKVPASGARVEIVDLFNDSCLNGWACGNIAASPIDIARERDDSRRAGTERQRGRQKARECEREESWTAIQRDREQRDQESGLEKVRDRDSDRDRERRRPRERDGEGPTILQLLRVTHCLSSYHLVPFYSVPPAQPPHPPYAAPWGNVQASITTFTRATS